jgi:hypothetical protein
VIACNETTPAVVRSAKMKRVLPAYLLLSFLLLSCKKDKEGVATGIVLSQTGCFDDYYLVAIDNPDYSKHSFLRKSIMSSCAGCYDCSNAAFVQLNSSFGRPGIRIAFEFIESIPSCLSNSEAPEHITAKNVRKL